MNEDSSTLPTPKSLSESPSPSSDTIPRIGSHRKSPPSLYPAPGVLQGSRKRRVFSRHGPFSSTINYSQGTQNSYAAPAVPVSHFSAKVTPTLSLLDAHGAEAESESDFEDVKSPQLQAPRSSNCTTPITTPKGPSKETKDTISGNEESIESSLYRTPARARSTTSNNGGIAMSPLSSDMQFFQHLSIRSPRLSKSPGSSFSQYTRSATSIGAGSSVNASANVSACAVTLNTPITAQGSFDGSDATMSVQNQHHCSNRAKMVPLTIISNKFLSNSGTNCKYPTPTPTNVQDPFSSSPSSSGVPVMDTSTSTRKSSTGLTPRSARMRTIISPRPRNPSGYLPCPTPIRSLPSPRRRGTDFFFNDLEKYVAQTATTAAAATTQAAAAAVVSAEKPVLDNRQCPSEDISTMMTLSPLDLYHQPTHTTVPAAPIATIESAKLTSEPPPPIAFLSTDQARNKGKNKNAKEDNGCNGDDLENDPWSLKRKGAMQMSTSRSLFKPASTASNDALNEMLLDDGDTDGTLSDSDDDGGDNGFFLSDPSTLSLPHVLALPPRGSLSSALNSKSRLENAGSTAKSDQSEGGGLGMSLTAAYSFKTKKKKVQSAVGGDQPMFPKLSANADCTSQNRTIFKEPPHQNREVLSSESNTSLFGMNIIHENSISNGSMADIGMFSSAKKNSCRSFTNEEAQPSGSLLIRSKSDQSINSLGLCIDNCPGSSDGYSSRDMVTPPVVCSRALSSPPPLKKG